MEWIIEIKISQLKKLLHDARPEVRMSKKEEKDDHIFPEYFYL